MVSYYVTLPVRTGIAHGQHLQDEYDRTPILVATTLEYRFTSGFRAPAHAQVKGGQETEQGEQKAGQKEIATGDHRQVSRKVKPPDTVPYHCTYFKVFSAMKDNSSGPCSLLGWCPRSRRLVWISLRWQGSIPFSSLSDQLSLLLGVSILPPSLSITLSTPMSFSLARSAHRNKPRFLKADLVLGLSLHRVPLSPPHTIVKSSSRVLCNGHHRDCCVCQHQPRLIFEALRVCSPSGSPTL